MSEHELLNIKNPFSAFNYSHKHNIWKSHINDKNGFVWTNFLETHYFAFLEYKIKDISVMDYYVLLYYLEIFGIITNKLIIHYSQIALCSIPKIYETDHIHIVQYIDNHSFHSGLTNIILYRGNNKNNKGKLLCIYSENENDKISFSQKEPNLKNINNKYCCINGIIKELPKQF
jgi:hypothetical protein